MHDELYSIFRRKRPWPDWGIIPGFLGGTEENYEKIQLGEDSRSSKQILPEYMSRTLLCSARLGNDNSGNQYLE
jgi:hypothetical protein